MSSRALWRIVVVGLVGAGLAACNDQGPIGSGGTDTAPDAAATVVDAGSASEAGQAEDEATTEGRISSGAFQLGPTQTLPVRPQAPEGVRRIVPLEEAVAGATFTVLEPKVLPPDTYRDVVHLESPQEGESSPVLPAVRFVYTLSAGGALVLYQHPATGEEGPGTSVDVGGSSGWLVEGDQPMVTWEQDGVRLELRGDTDVDTLLAAARSVGPVDADSE